MSLGSVGNHDYWRGHPPMNKLGFNINSKVSAANPGGCSWLGIGGWWLAVDRHLFFNQGRPTHTTSHQRTSTSDG